MKNILTFINPIAHLGTRKYSVAFSLLVTLTAAILLEMYVYWIVKDPNAIGSYAIFIFIALIIYFAFRDGIRGGVTATVITIVYYGYIIYTRNYTGDRLESGVRTTIILGILYCILAGVIGWLKQTIDALIEREANEKRRLQAIVQQLPVGIIITDEKGCITYANKQTDEILGKKTPIGYVVGKKTLIEYSQNGKTVSINKAPLVQAVFQGKSTIEEDYTIYRKDKRIVHVRVSASPIHNKDGKIIAAASIISDITGQKELEMRKDDFVNMASHELKTPLTSMKLYIDLLSKKINKQHDESSIKLIANIKNQTYRLQKLVNDLLDVSRMQTGKLSFNKEDIRLDEIVEESVELLQGSAKQKIKITKKIPVKIYADRFRIYQVVTNLINNAIKYSPDDKDIHVKINKVDNKAIVSVQDQGLGIDKSQQKRIFERLYQVPDLKEKTFPGFGMGLYISKEIIKRHKGDIWVESEKGQGSTFYFSIPLNTK